MKSVALLSLFTFIATAFYAQPCTVINKWGGVKPVYSATTGKPDTNYYKVWNENGENGIVSWNGQLIIPIQYDDDFEISGAMVVANNRDKKIVDLWNLSTKTKVKLPGISGGEVVGSNGLVAVEAANHKWGYSDSKGKLVLPCKYDYAQEFINNNAVVNIGEKYGVINDKGAIIIPVKYSELLALGQNLLLTRRENEKAGETYFGLMDYTAKVVVPVIYTDYKKRDGIIEFRKEAGKSILYNYSGKPLTNEDVQVPTAGEKSLYVEDGRLAVIGTDKKWFIIDTLGVKYLVGKYYFLYAPKNILNDKPSGVYLFAASSEEDAAIGVVKLDGTVLLQDVYKDIISATENRFFVKKLDKGAKYSLVDAEGRTIAANICDVCIDFSRYFLIAKKDGKYGVLNSLTGEVKVPFTYESLKNYNNCSMTFGNGEAADTYDENFQKLSDK